MDLVTSQISLEFVVDYTPCPEKKVFVFTASYSNSKAFSVAIAT